MSKARRRFNIDVTDESIRRQVKIAAVKKDITIREYCMRALEAQLIRDGERSPEETRKAARKLLSKSVRIEGVKASDLVRAGRRERSIG